MFGNSMKVGIFVPCCVDQLAAESGVRMVRLLEGIGGMELFVPTEMTCCGMALYNDGDRDGAKLLGEKMISLYGDCTHIVGLGSGCVSYIKTHFGNLFHNTTLHNNYRQFADRCYDLSDFLVNVVHYQPTAGFAHKVAFMDHCGTLRDYVCTAHPNQRGLHDEPRQLLQSIEGLNLGEMKESDVCCGYGGQIANDYTPIAHSLGLRKVENALAAGAEYIVSTEMNCLLHLRSVIANGHYAIRCLHLVDVLSNDELAK